MGKITVGRRSIRQTVLAITTAVVMAASVINGLAGVAQAAGRADPEQGKAEHVAVTVQQDPKLLLANNTYTLTNVNSGKCLDVVYGGKDNFVPVIQYTCYGGPIQQWRLTGV